MRLDFALLVSLVGLVLCINERTNAQTYSPSDMVNITLYYESLCPASRGFSIVYESFLK